MGKEPEHFSKEDIQMANKYIKRRPIIRHENQNHNKIIPHIH